MGYSGVLSVEGNTVIKGWAKNSTSSQPVVLDIILDGEIVDSVVANEKRFNIKTTENETQLCGFTYKFDEYKPSIFTNLKVCIHNTNHYIYPDENYKNRILNHVVRHALKNVKETGLTNNKNRKCYLHIGMHKTGSSSIQKYLFENTLTDDIEYLPLKPANHSILFYSIFTVNPENYHINQRRNYDYYKCLENNKQKLSEIVEFLKDSKRNIVISGEDISVLNLGELKRFKEFLSSFFDEIEVVIYIRDPHSFLVSVFQESVKGGVAAGASFSSLSSNVLYPNYKTVIERFDEIFGQEFINVRLFNKQHLIKCDVVHDFLSVIGIKIEKKLARTNESLSSEELSIVYLYNKYVISKYGLNAKTNSKLSQLLDRVKPLAHTKFQVSQEVTNDIIKENYDNLLWLVDRIENSHIEDFFPKSAGSEQGLVIKNEQQFEKMGWEQIEKLLGLT